jgi:hypothetical protein
MFSRRLVGPLLAPCLLCAVSGSPSAQDARPTTIQWRTDYHQARAESDKKGLPLFIDFTTTPCLWCDKLEKLTFSDQRVVSMLNQNYIPLKVHQHFDPKLTQDMRISAFPTLVLAAPGGKIVKTEEGFREADVLHDLLQRTAANVMTPDWMKQQLELAQKSFTEGDYGRSYTALKGILDDSKGRSIHPSAQKLMTEIEQRADERLARAKELLNSGRATEAAKALTDTMRSFHGLPVANSASDLLTTLVKSTEERQHARTKRAGELLVQARDFYKAKEVIPCLDRCEILLASFGDLPEGMEASQIIQEIRGNQEWLQLASDTLSDRLASVYLALADSNMKRGKPREAEAFLRRVIQAFPGTRYAESAQIRIGQLQGIPPGSVDVTGTMK